MHKAHLRKIGGSVMLAVPPALLDILQLQPGVEVGIRLESGCLIVEPRRKPRYTMEQLIAKCERKGPRSKEEREWLDSKQVGRELI